MSMTTELTVLTSFGMASPTLAVETEMSTGLRGAPGKPGVGAAEVSSDPNNRLEQRNDGLYVSNDLTPDPLAYYILAKG